MFSLEEIQTNDGLLHQGIVAFPETPGKRAIVFVHGLTSTYYGNRLFINALAKQSTEKGIAFGSFNNRGHDMITGIRRVDPKEPKGYGHVMGGAGYEHFEESELDIDAAVSFFVDRGYTEIVIVGHSTGANKASYYAGRVKKQELIGVVLLCPMSDRLGPFPERDRLIEEMNKRIEKGEGEKAINGISFFPMTPKRFVSLFSAHTPEDQFDYGDPEPRMPEYSNIQKSLFVLFAGNDENADRPISEIKKVFDAKAKSRTYTSAVIPTAFHNFVGLEHDVAHTVVNWCALL